jgi:hypothetical protein
MVFLNKTEVPFPTVSRQVSRVVNSNRVLRN